MKTIIKKLLTVMLGLLMLVTVAGCSKKEEVAISSTDVVLNIPSYYYVDEKTAEEGITQEIIDEIFASDSSVKSAVLNNDNSVTVIMDRNEYEAMMKEIEQVILNSLEDVKDEELSEIDHVTVNKDFTEYEVHMKGTEINTYDSLISTILIMQSEYYLMLCGTPEKEIIVKYYDNNGNLLDE